MNYRYGRKGTSVPAEGLPLFIYLHGSGDPDGEWANGLSLGQSWNDAPSAYFIPQIPNTGELYRWWQRGKQWAWEKLLRQAFVGSDINPDRIYVFGISEGGYGRQPASRLVLWRLLGCGRPYGWRRTPEERSR